MQKFLLAAAGLVLIAACMSVAFWTGRSSNSTVAERPPATPPAPPSASEDAIDVEPSLAVGSRVEALSAEGWQVAVIKEVRGGQALIDYERGSLDDERLDVRLLRKPGAELESRPVPPARVGARTQAAPAAPPASGPIPATPPAPPLGPQGNAAVAIGSYSCSFDAMVLSVQGAPADGSKPVTTLTLEIVSDRVYRAFNGGDDAYSYDPASGRITWKDGMMGEEPPGQYRADSRSIVTTVGGHAMTCRFRS